MRPPGCGGRRFAGRMNAHGENTHPETFNPWSIVNLVFHHLVAEGLHPVLGESGDPGAPAAELLRALGITPDAEGNRQVSEQTKRDLERIRAVFDVSHVESS